ncbi:hypothetical protein B0O99DRAFT_517968 [Bisporella sp. PMI_857]|nr:hypothetical protein B0O99DRAFT_517968 [Bisporella sp. PMI_857]
MAALALPIQAVHVPYLQVPACPRQGTIQYHKNLTGQDFPLTQVDLCYSDSTIEFTFTAFNETSFYANASLGTNDQIWRYEVMEAFIYQGTKDPQTYLEFEVSPANQTFQAFIYNPSKVRAAGAVFDRFYIENIYAVGLTATTTLNKNAKIWVSKASIPLGLFNVDNGTAKGTQWRMNFFRTVTDAGFYPNQFYGAWNPPNEINFHMTPFFGKVKFV